MGSVESALTQVKAWLAQADLAPDGRLPPERELCDVLGVSRGELRKALAKLEQDGEIWRQVGKGTFLGPRPIEAFLSIATIAKGTSPLEVMQARLLVEPMLAREAAINATGAHLDEMHRCARLQREAATWRQYENADNRLHRTVAEAAGNSVLTALFDQLNAVRRAVVWGRRRNNSDRPSIDHHSFAQHDAIVRAIVERDQENAYKAMYEHLTKVRDNLLKSGSATDLKMPG
ncbi:MAG: FCD domain-containing protein [Gammaproteobacteria bacterium]|nr:FCD domain-containing protein [Gammaproteobacteria bacterium]MDH3447952.1 FCD domain-containing protein [Gammaproteobacteria bacterium]